MSAAVDLFVEEARAVSVAEAVDRLGLGELKGAGTTELVGPCPACGGEDRFQVNRVKGAWLCRGSAEGRDAIGLAAHILGLDVRRREEFLLVCAAVTLRPVPEGEEESEDARRAREEKLAETRAKTEAKSARDARESADFRARERRKARGKWEQAGDGADARAYLAARLGCAPRDLPELPLLRVIRSEPYWHGKDAADRPQAIHEGLAMVAPFVDPFGEVIGCHLTWIQLSADAAPKFRPRLLDEDGASLPTKKMRGTKKGGAIPLVGYVSEGGRIVPAPGRTRLVSGEGIENTVAMAVLEGPRADTLYAAAGDLGNLAGPADPASAFSHPTLKNRGGKAPLRIAGPVPREGQGPEEALQVPDGVGDVVFLGDADSEPVATSAAMLRAEWRVAAKGRTVSTLWPEEGADFADMLAALLADSALLAVGA